MFLSFSIFALLDAMKKSFFYYKKKLDNLNDEEKSQQQLENQQSGDFENNTSTNLFDKCALSSADESRTLDTVGAIALDTSGHLASAVSSGGILLKLPGRVGHASFFGCGCWVDERESNAVTEESNSIAACTTGCGEYIIKTLFAKQCVDHIFANLNKIDYDLSEFYKEKFFGNF